MKKTIALAAAAILSATAAFADPVVGVWKTQPGEDGNYGHVSIKKCGANICGILGQGFDSSGNPVKSDNIGKRMIWDMGSDGGGYYSGGKIWAPDTGKTYKSKMKLSGNKLKVSGCVIGICRSQSWTRLQ